jgi:hypothetical protein
MNTRPKVLRMAAIPGVRDLSSVSSFTETAVSQPQ